MRMHINIEDSIIAELDRRVGARRRSAFITALIRRALDDERRWDDVEASIGTVSDHGHAWGDDPAQWVRAGRRSDARRSG